MQFPPSGSDRTLIAAIESAVAGTFQILGELGRDGERTTAFLARDVSSGALVALELRREAAGEGGESSFDLFVRPQLDSSLPSMETRCTGCGDTIRGWVRYCSRCDRDLSGVAQVTGQTSAADLTRAVDEAAAGRYEMLGEMARAEGGGRVYFARERESGRLVALRLEKEPDATLGRGHVLAVTGVMPVVPPSAKERPAARPPRVTMRGSPQTAMASYSATQIVSRDVMEDESFCPVCGTTFPSSVRFCPKDGAAVRPRRRVDDLVGRIVGGRYRIAHKLGEGGMGQVYLAEHVRMDRTYALKVLNRELKDDPEAVARFAREAAHASHISHANVATVHDVGETDDGLVYLAMEYIAGESLSELMKREGALEPRRACEIMRQVADALDAAHSLGIVHRDLKPDNILLARGRDGGDVVKLVDFGIAKAIEATETQNITRTGFVVGTPKYMSPEQIRNETVDGRSDIYSAGCILYEMLVGEPPFSGPSGEVAISRRLSEPPPHPRSKNRGLPRKLDELVVRAMATAQGERFESAQVLRAALGRALRPDEESVWRKRVAAASAFAKGRLAAFRHAVARELPRLAPRRIAEWPPVRRIRALRIPPNWLAETARIRDEAGRVAGRIRAQAIRLGPIPLGIAGASVLGIIAVTAIVRAAREPDVPSVTSEVTRSVVEPIVSPPPAITSVDPPSVPLGGDSLTLLVTGANFLPGAVVEWDGEAREATYVDVSTLRLRISGGDLAEPGRHELRVANGDSENDADGRTATFFVRLSPPGPFLAIGGEHTCAVNATGEAYCWGRNGVGQLGDSSTVDRAEPTRVATSVPFVSVAAGRDHACALTPWGSALCWGDGSHGRTGTGDGAPRIAPTPVAGGISFVRLTAGDFHTCGLRVNGTAYCWGWNQHGQLGDGSTIDRATPTPVEGGMRFHALFAGASHTCGIITNGELRCWGRNDSGQLGDGTSEGRPQPVSVAGSLRFTTIAAGLAHTCGIAGSATYCWGAGGRLGNGDFTSSNEPVAVNGPGLASISARGDHTCGLTDDGTAWCWGDNRFVQNGTGGGRWTSQPVRVAQVPELRAIAVGPEHSCGLTDSNAAYCWGNNAFGQLGGGAQSVRSTPAPVARATAGYTEVSAGRELTCALMGNSPMCWGGNSAGQVGDNTQAHRSVPTPLAREIPIATISAGTVHACGLSMEGAAWCWGDGSHGQLGNGSTNARHQPSRVAGSHNFQSISAGDFHTCGVSGRGELYCWGANHAGQIGDGTRSARTAPTRINVEGKSFRSVSAGVDHTCAVTAGNELYCWGGNYQGQVGDGSTDNERPSPVRIDAGEPVADVSAGWQHTCAVTTSGGALCWGFNGAGELGDGSSVRRPEPVAVAGNTSFREVSAGFQFTCGVSTEDRALCWGSNYHGQAGNPAATSYARPTPVSDTAAFAAVDVSFRHACGVTRAGAVLCWGTERFGELGMELPALDVSPAMVSGGLVFDTPPPEGPCTGARCVVSPVTRRQAGQGARVTRAGDALLVPAHSPPCHGRSWVCALRPVPYQAAR